MGPKVTAILVAHDAGAYLDRTLEALAAQTRAPDQVVLVDIGEHERLTEHPSGLQSVQHIAAPSTLSLGQAVQAAVRIVAPAAGDDEWLWLLAADNAPDPDALRAMLAALEISPSVSVAGPKLMQWADPEYLYSFGESMTRFGTSVELAEPLLDQAQYDRESDVLAVAASGMLVRHRVWDRLEGFDPALPAMDDALDFCIRARLAGHRVALVPEAKVLSAGRRAPGTALLGPRTSRGRRSRLARTAQLHRRLAYAPALAVPLHWLSLLPLALVRALGQLLRKQPESSLGEFGAALAVAFAHLASVARSRRRLRHERVLGWSAIASLRLPWAEIRRRRALAREDATAARRIGRHDIRFFPAGARGPSSSPRWSGSRSTFRCSAPAPLRPPVCCRSRTSARSGHGSGTPGRGSARASSGLPTPSRGCSRCSARSPSGLPRPASSCCTSPRCRSRPSRPGSPPRA
ncbi:glycosyltransferase family 2 protein [Naasia aerilata]|uniref:GT2 family glycosyltransferase n=1 Tax=Naasia aerilata TaxID=1162966 RepID=A0ABM8GCK3_9MICO|nr:glycosyltransferase family 2 protein [Naasia aerilata]BDZ45979.1 hypothetical protein GCM10025866_18880 [Naasia aerilata]